MAMTDTQDQIRATKEKLLQDLTADYADAYAQSVNDPNPVTRNQAGRNAEELEWRMNKIEQELNKRERNRPLFERDRVQIERELEQHLHEIDFEQVDDVLRGLFAQPNAAGRAGLLLFQNSSPMNGDRCAHRVRERLSLKTGSGKFRFERVELQTSGINGRFPLLRSIAPYFDADVAELPDGERLLAEVCDKIVASVAAGGILLIEIGGCERLEHDPGAFEWLVVAFWRRLLEDLSNRPDARLVTLVVVLFVDLTVPDGALTPDICSDDERFRRDCVRDVPLVPWTYEDVLQWIASYAAPDGYPQQELEWLAQRVIKAANGEPCRIEQELLRRCAILSPS